MRMNLLGNVLLIFAFLLASAGIPEPSRGLSAASALFIFVGFAILMWESHNTWASGYEAAKLDMRFDAGVPGRDDDGLLWKCGSSGCTCANDPTYQPVCDL